MLTKTFKHPKKQYVYAITGGTFLGELFVYMEQKHDEFIFLSLPDMKIRKVPCDKLEFGLQQKIIDIVEKLPAHVYETCLKQYNKNNTLNTEVTIK